MAFWQAPLLLRLEACSAVAWSIVCPLGALAANMTVCQWPVCHKVTKAEWGSQSSRCSYGVSVLKKAETRKPPASPLLCAAQWGEGPAEFPAPACAETSFCWLSYPAWEILPQQLHVLDMCHKPPLKVGQMYWDYRSGDLASDPKVSPPLQWDNSPGLVTRIVTANVPCKSCHS